MLKLKKILNKTEIIIYHCLKHVPPFRGLYNELIYQNIDINKLAESIISLTNIINQHTSVLKSHQAVFEELLKSERENLIDKLLIKTHDKTNLN